MNVLETVMVAAGLSLDTCALMMCKGAILPRLKKEKIIQICFINMIWQAAALLLGNLIRSLPFIKPEKLYIQTGLSLTSVFIFLGLAIYMFVKFLKDTPIYEHRTDDFTLKEICIWSWATSQDAFFSGIGFGLLNTDLLMQTILILTVTALAVTIGLHCGYRLGFDHKSKVYLTGSVLLFCAGIDVIIQFLL